MSRWTTLTPLDGQDALRTGKDEDAEALRLALYLAPQDNLRAASVAVPSSGRGK
jgi:hypothetical protein